MRSIVLVLVLGVVWVTAACSPGDDGSSGGDLDPDVADRAQHFLDTYVTEDGQVLRHDQGDDTVSEGQAYAMLLAEAVGDDDLARTIWEWTDEHLARDDGLLAFHADSSGNVIDEQPATDADTLMAWALLRYDGGDADELHSAGGRLADAVLQEETVDTPAGRVPAAGPWATGDPPTINPSYWMPGVARTIGELTGDDTWDDMADAMADVLGDATSGGSTLPTDWTTLDGGSLEPIGSPDGQYPVQYGPDAQRVPIFYAATCEGDGQELAAQWWDKLSGADNGALALTPDGGTVNGARSPLALMAASAAARVAGDNGAADDLEQQAADQAEATPTYYGDAWVALGPLLLDGPLSPC